MNKVNIGLIGILVLLLIVIFISFTFIKEINFIKEHLELMINMLEDIDSDLHDNH
jgi:hypothetical protein